MSYTVKQKVLTIRLIAFCVTITLIALNLFLIQAQGAEIPLDGAKDNVKQEQQEQKPQPDIWLGFINWPGFKPYKPFLTPLQDSVGQITRPLSQQILSTIPLAPQIYTQYDSIGGILSGLNPISLLANFGSSSSGYDASKVNQQKPTVQTNQ